MRTLACIFEVHRNPCYRGLEDFNQNFCLGERILNIFEKKCFLTLALFKIGRISYSFSRFPRVLTLRPIIQYNINQLHIACEENLRNLNM